MTIPVDRYVAGREPERGARRPKRATAAGAALAGLGLLGLATLADAWPAVLDGGGVHLCSSRPSQESDGSWTCRSGPVVYQGNLVEVSQGPYGPPMVTTPGRPPYGPYGGYGPWGPPDRGPSGYDALDPWLGSKSSR